MNGNNSKQVAASSKPGVLTIGTAILLWLMLTTGGALIALPYNPRNITVVALLFFNNLNLLIAICEIILGLHIKTIQEEYQRNLQTYKKGREWRCALDFLTMPLPNPFSARAWSRMWSTYAIYDPSYQNHESFGFFIDVGNGWSTIPPCLLWNAAMAFPNHSNSLVSSPLLVGCVGLASYWQVCYGAILYIVSYLYNQRYAGKSKLENFCFVGLANSLWFFFPILGMYAAVQILRDGDLRVFE